MRKNADLIANAEELTSKALGWGSARPAGHGGSATRSQGDTQPGTVEEETLRDLWASLWPEKAFGQLKLEDGRIDPEVGAWVITQLKRAGTRFLLVEGRPALARWPEQDGPEYRLALNVADLGHLRVYSRDDPDIQWLLSGQHPGRSDL